MAGREIQIVNVSLYIVRKDYSYLCMWMTSNWLERNTILIRCGKYSTKKSIWENQHPSLIMYTWAALKDNVKEAKILWTSAEPCLNREFPRAELKNFHNLRIFTSLHGLMIWLVMQRNACEDIANFRIRQLKEKQKWSEEKLHLENARKLRGSISSTLRTSNSKKPSRMLVRNWKHQWLLLCLVKL